MNIYFNKIISCEKVLGVNYFKDFFRIEYIIERLISYPQIEIFYKEWAGSYPKLENDMTKVMIQIFVK